jgi:hypothetical protein
MGLHEHRRRQRQLRLAICVGFSPAAWLAMIWSSCVATVGLRACWGKLKNVQKVVTRLSLLFSQAGIADGILRQTRRPRKAGRFHITEKTRISVSCNCYVGST